MNKNWLAILLVCVLTVIPAAVSAEELQLDIKCQYMPSIRPIAGTNLILMESKVDNSLGVFDSEGNELIPYGLEEVNKLDDGYLSVSKNKSELNRLAIFKQNGAQISDYLYGSISVYGANWVAGDVLAEPTDGEKDVKIGKTYYKLVRKDFYYVTDEGAALIGSLDRMQFKASKLHGDYFSIQNQEDAVIVYDQNLQPIDTFTPKNVNAAYFQVTNYQIINNITNETIADGYTAVEEAYLPSRMLLLATVANEDGSASQGILDTDGNVLMPAEYKVVAMDDPYVLVANQEGLQGLYSLDEQRLVVPCEFSGIIACETSVDSYVNNGYICVELNGKLGFVDARTGEISCPPAYNSRIAKAYGASIVFDGENGYVVIAGDGTRSELFDLEEIAATNGDGYLLVAKKDGFYGVIDWHGNEMLPFIHKNIITLTSDSKAMIRTSTGMEFDVITVR